MKQLLCISVLIAGAATVTVVFAQQPGPELVQAGVAAYNSQDPSYFEQHLADDVIWLDEDGHTITGKSAVLGFLRNLFKATPARTLRVSNVRVGNTSDAAGATFAYRIMGWDEHRMGLNTTVFKKAGNDWQIVVIHGAVNAAGHH